MCQRRRLVHIGLYRRLRLLASYRASSAPNDCYSSVSAWNFVWVEVERRQPLAIAKLQVIYKRLRGLDALYTQAAHVWTSQSWPQLNGISSCSTWMHHYVAHLTSEMIECSSFDRYRNHHPSERTFQRFIHASARFYCLHTLVYFRSNCTAYAACFPCRQPLHD